MIAREREDEEEKTILLSLGQVLWPVGRLVESSRRRFLVSAPFNRTTCRVRVYTRAPGICCSRAKRRASAVHVHDEERLQNERARRNEKPVTEEEREREGASEPESGEDARCRQTKRDDGGGNEKPYTFITRCPLDRATAAGKTFH